ncbi:MAG: primosomal protein N' [Pseudomonadota bacterium]
MTEIAPVYRLCVAVDTPQHSGLSGPLDYTSVEPVPPGSLVRVPLGRREVLGVVWHHPADGEAAPQTLRPVREVLKALPPLGQAWRDLVDFAAGYYQRSVGELAATLLPSQLHALDDAQLAKRVSRLGKRFGGADAGAAPEAAPELQEEQRSVLHALRTAAAGAQAPPPVLLYGVTGSGKTEVYLQAAADMLAAGKQVLVLVPEINLTPQLQARFEARFAGRRLVTLHSGLTPAQRLAHWLAAHLGEADLVLGTRLAVFTPLPRLGLIVVDEEHDPSYKQQEGARYSARDLAVYRGQVERLPVLLGSATPSLETWQRAATGRYQKLVMRQRVGGGALPQVRVVDMNVQPRAPGSGTALSPALLEALKVRLARGEQSLVFLNRRGYAPVLHCSACGWKSGCPHCSAWRVFHKADRMLRCHHCGFAERVPRACPDCGNLDISALGRGTERLEEQLGEALPGARIARIDADSTRAKGALESRLQAVHAGEVDVLVGTQMIAKGHDFRRITLVAAVNPDSALFSSDFRAPERLFALLMQAAGRAGRDAAVGAGAEMWVQTWHPQHALYAALRRHDYDAFAESQLREREAAGLPPFASLALLRAEARSVDIAAGFLEAAAVLANAEGHGKVTVYPPVPPAISRVANVERMQMLLESPSRTALQGLLRRWAPQLQGLRAQHKGVLRWAVDVDPLAI